jgi:hypothetical protein
MVHKIKGWARDFEDHGTGYELGNGGGWAEFSEDGKEGFGDVPCTLVTTHERVFTESEVKAMLVNITHECGCYENRGEPVFATKVDDINHIAAKHGIVLDHG